MADDKKSKEVIEEVKSTKEESTLYYFYSTGCAFCKKVEPVVNKLNSTGYDILKLDLSDKDNQGLKNELQKEYKVKCGTPWLVDANTGNNICGFRDEATIKKWADGEEIPAPLKPKSPPPPPPADFDNDEEVNIWKEAYEKWSTQNQHLPNLPGSDDMFNRLKKQREIIEQRSNQNSDTKKTIGKFNTTEARILSLEEKIDRLLNHLGVR